MSQPERRVNVRFECDSGHRHPICVRIDREVPPELRCLPDADPGYSIGGGGCSVPPFTMLAEATARELRENFQESKRQGYVLIRR